MKSNSLLVLLFFLIPFVINGQTQEATNSYGKKVILNADGTWKYAEEATTSDGKKVILNADGTWKYSEVNKDSRMTGNAISDDRDYGLSYDLGGRGVQNLISPKYDIQKEGIVVVDISVDQNGNVKQALPGAKGSTVLDEDLLNVSKEAALKTKFVVKKDAPVVQKGTIKYIFKIK